MSFFDFNWNTYSGISPVKYSSIDSTSPMETIFTRKTRKRKRTSTPSNYTEDKLDKLDELDKLYKDIFDDVARNLPKSTSVNRNILNDYSSSPENTPNQDIHIPELQSLELQSLERDINNKLRRSIRIKSIIADKKEQDDYKIIEELEDKIKNTPKESVSNDNTNVDITPTTTLNNLITTGKTPLTDLIINFIKTQENSVIQTLKIEDISPVYNKKLQGCFDKVNITGIKIRDASCDFIKDEQQMNDIWGIKVVTDYAKSKNACCYLCNNKIDPGAPPEMEHKIVCPIVFTQFLHYNRLKNLYFTGDKTTTSIFTLWNDFKKLKQDSLKNLYSLINCSSSNKYPKEDINTKFNDIFTVFKNYIKTDKKIKINNDNEFTFYKSFIKFWLMEFAYAHHTCNQGKHHHSYNTSCGMKTGITQTAKRSKSKTDNKVKKENDNVGMEKIVQGTKDRTSYLIEHFQHIIECGQKVCNNYQSISRATQQIDAELATSIFIIKNLRRMYQSTKKRNNNKSNTRKRKKKSRR